MQHEFRTPKGCVWKWGILPTIVISQGKWWWTTINHWVKGVYWYTICRQTQISFTEAFFPGPAADLFSRLPAAIETLQGRLGSDERLGSSWDGDFGGKSREIYGTSIWNLGRSWENRRISIVFGMFSVFVRFFGLVWDDLVLFSRNTQPGRYILYSYILFSRKICLNVG